MSRTACRQGTEWTATLRELPNESKQVIGTIAVPETWQRLGCGSAMWSERYKTLHPGWTALGITLIVLWVLAHVVLFFLSFLGGGSPT